MSSAVKLLIKGSSITSLTDKVTDADVKRMGYLKKLKTMKKKFFVLHVETESGPSRLEYFDTEKKWRTGTVPKRSINLKTCFNINRKLDTKHKFVIALYTKDDCFAVSLESETELDQWLTALLELQHGNEYLDSDEKPKPNFEHVWQVVVKSKGLGSSKNILGPHRLCLTERALSLVKMSTDYPNVQEFPLMSIRRCGHSDCFFFMEVGRSAMTGAGELWMLTEDTLIAQNMHEAILNAMKSSRKDDVAPRPRTRSSSANEASKPISVHTRRQPTSSATATAVAAAIDAANANCRERADSMPARPRTVSDGPNPDISTRMYARTMSCSPPQNAISPVSGMYDSTGSSVSMDDCDSSQPEMMLGKYGHTLAEDMPTEPPIEEEVMSGSDSYISMAPGEVSVVSTMRNRSNVDDRDGYMEMNPSAGLDMSLTPPGIAAFSGVSSVLNQSKALMNSPLSLNLGPTCGPKSFIPPQPLSASTESYMEMSSPVSNPGGTPDGYMPMSPLGSSYLVGNDKTRTSVKNGYTSSSGQISASSGGDRPNEVVASIGHTVNGQVHPPQAEGKDSYVAMAPIKDCLPSILKGHSPSQEDEGYIDMTPMGHSLPRSTLSGNAELKPDAFSSRRSSGTSGTPSTDMCFAEYQLDKVRAYFTPSEDDDDDDEEPMIRACSIGSRSDCNRKRDKLLEVETDSARTRAFSMGSRVGVKFGSKAAAAANAAALPVAEKTPEENKNKKSSSAPVLGTSPLGGSSWASTSYLQKVYAAGNRPPNANEDLMEMDFPDSKNCSSGSLAEGSRKSAASSTDSLRRAPSTGSRPRTNSRSSHSRPTKLETLQSIGESSSPSSSKVQQINYGDYDVINVSSAALSSPPHQTRMMTGEEDAATGPRSKLTSKLSAQLSLDYLDVNTNRSDFGDVLGGGHKLKDNRKRSLPEQILRGQAPPTSTSKADGRTSPSGEYVNIDPNRSPRISSISENDTTKRNLEYVNLQYGSFEGSSAALSKPIPVAAAAAIVRRIGDSIVQKPADVELKKETPSSSGSGGSNQNSFSLQVSHGDYALMEPSSLKSDSSPVGDVSGRLGPSAGIVDAATSLRPNVARHSSLIATATAVVVSSTPSSSTSSSSQSNNNDSLLRPSSVAEAPYENLSFGKPNSTSCERELNYASLDLAPTMTEDDGLDISPTTATTMNSDDSAALANDGRPLSYAKIDFAKSEGFRYTSSSSANENNLV